MWVWWVFVVEVGDGVVVVGGDGVFRLEELDRATDVAISKLGLRLLRHIFGGGL